MTSTRDGTVIIDWIIQVSGKSPLPTQFSMLPAIWKMHESLFSFKKLFSSLTAKKLWYFKNIYRLVKIRKKDKGKKNLFQRKQKKTKVFMCSLSADLWARSTEFLPLIPAKVITTCWAWMRSQTSARFHDKKYSTLSFFYLNLEETDGIILIGSFYFFRPVSTFQSGISYIIWKKLKPWAQN